MNGTNGFSNPDSRDVLNQKIQRVVRSAGFQPAGVRASCPQYDVQAEMKSRGRLPHLNVRNGIYFVTWNLFDAIPFEVLKSIQLEKDAIKQQSENSLSGLSKNNRKKMHRRFHKIAENCLDKNYGNCWLGKPECAEIVAGALSYFNTERYRLMGWVVMPNHVHVVVMPYEGYDISDILYSWKSFSANEINKILGRKGKVWQTEYYDRIIRNEKHFESALNYVVDNPVKAGLSDWRWVGING